MGTQAMDLRKSLYIGEISIYAPTGTNISTYDVTDKTGKVKKADGCVTAVELVKYLNGPSENYWRRTMLNALADDITEASEQGKAAKAEKLKLSYFELAHYLTTDRFKQLLRAEMAFRMERSKWSDYKNKEAKDKHDTEEFSYIEEHGRQLTENEYSQNIKIVEALLSGKRKVEEVLTDTENKIDRAALAKTISVAVAQAQETKNVARTTKLKVLYYDVASSLEKK